MRCGVQSRCRKRPPQKCALAHSFFAKDPAESRNSSHWNLKKESHCGKRRQTNVRKTKILYHNSDCLHIRQTAYWKHITDEHGQKIELKAEEAGITPKEFVDNVSGEIKKIWDLMDTSYDKFIRTTDEDHEKQVQKIFQETLRQREIFTRDIMKECTVHRVSLSSQSLSL